MVSTNIYIFHKIVYNENNFFSIYLLKDNNEKKIDFILPLLSLNKTKEITEFFKFISIYKRSANLKEIKVQLKDNNEIIILKFINNEVLLEYNFQEPNTNEIINYNNCHLITHWDNYISVYKKYEQFLSLGDYSFLHEITDNEFKTFCILNPLIYQSLRQHEVKYTIHQWKNYLKFEFPILYQKKKIDESKNIKREDQEEEEEDIILINTFPREDNNSDLRYFQYRNDTILNCIRKINRMGKLIN